MELALLVDVKFSTQSQQQATDFAEFIELARSAGAEIATTVASKRAVPDPKYLIGLGKVEEIALEVKAKAIDLVLFNHQLTPSQERNLEQKFSCRVLDRTGLILDIFAQRARTFEGKLQVELAQLQHMSTRLVRGWTHLERQKGGIGLRGPGETQLEVDRRLIRGRIKTIAARLDKVKSQRQQNRQARHKFNIPTVSLVGYTNAGKSTLFNTLTGDTVLAADQLFATLDPTLRSIQVPRIGKVILADTVGFIRDLPHDLIEAFQATLEETRDADLLLHVIDSQDLGWEDRKQQVELVLQNIGAEHVPVIEVYNKIDLVEQLAPGIKRDQYGSVQLVRVSAVARLGMDDLLTAIGESLCYDVIRGTVVLTADQARTRALLYDVNAVTQEVINADGNWDLQVVTSKTKWMQICAHDDKLNGLLKW